MIQCISEGLDTGLVLLQQNSQLPKHSNRQACFPPGTIRQWVLCAQIIFFSLKKEWPIRFCWPHMSTLRKTSNSRAAFSTSPFQSRRAEMPVAVGVSYHHGITFHLRKVGRRPNSSSKMFLPKDQPWHMRTWSLSRQAQWPSWQEGFPNPLHVAPGTAIGVCGQISKGILNRGDSSAQDPWKDERCWDYLCPGDSKRGSWGGKEEEGEGGADGKMHQVQNAPDKGRFLWSEVQHAGEDKHVSCVWCGRRYELYIECVAGGVNST